jgi:hypothetical protein
VGKFSNNSTVDEINKIREGDRGVMKEDATVFLGVFMIVDIVF